MLARIENDTIFAQLLTATVW